MTVYRKSFVGFLILICLISGISFVRTASAVEEPTPSPQNSTPGLKMNWTQFRVHQLSVFQSGGSSFSGILNWLPNYHFTDTISAGMSLGVSLLKGSTSNFFALEYTAFGNYQFNPAISVELHLGAQSWLGHGGTFVLAGFDGCYHLADRPFHLIDRIVVGYGALFITDRMTHEIRLGVGVDI